MRRLGHLGQKFGRGFHTIQAGIRFQPALSSREAPNSTSTLETTTGEPTGVHAHLPSHSCTGLPPAEKAHPEVTGAWSVWQVDAVHEHKADIRYVLVHEEGDQGDPRQGGALG